LDQAEISQATRYLFDGVVFSGEGDAKVDQEIVEFKEDGGRMQGWCGATYIFSFLPHPQSALSHCYKYFGSLYPDFLP
jgi:hypothetical protein